MVTLDAATESHGRGVAAALSRPGGWRVPKVPTAASKPLQPGRSYKAEFLLLL